MEFPKCLPSNCGVQHCPSHIYETWCCWWLVIGSIPRDVQSPFCVSHIWETVLLMRSAQLLVGTSQCAGPPVLCVTYMRDSSADEISSAIGWYLTMCRSPVLCVTYMRESSADEISSAIGWYLTMCRSPFCVTYMRDSTADEISSAIGWYLIMCRSQFCVSLILEIVLLMRSAQLLVGTS